jgi:hypothetical protein
MGNAVGGGHWEGSCFGLQGDRLLVSRLTTEFLDNILGQSFVDLAMSGHGLGNTGAWILVPIVMRSMRFMR